MYVCMYVHACVLGVHVPIYACMYVCVECVLACVCMSIWGGYIWTSARDLSTLGT